ncbi:MAG TPA: efflux RND transporter periplasmic adaptor subunit [Bacteroidales bacterium]|jgi:multidrug efflux pump subunit AcrA (membrane-fusion protein)|nr:efflux RND transporter periplasmic adaptor subunit [Bacteroidales bacterium]HOX73963.1 efflux RND transporter periplasmic adaptor subunit [Bacteroidales bacterium]HPM86375.1 efflux RND transporter periplasmic adaptor subunit [Bacteroidales bacterium]HQM68550.1 efflux RND transporter periplasmic adaptor subunit [Bacteroidales bacterium]
MKRTLIISGIVALAIIISLIVFNRLLSKKSEVSVFAEVKEGLFEIAISNSGELLAENSFDIKGPEIQQTQGPGGGQGGGSRGGGGHDHMRIMSFKIQDIIAEGTMVKKGDYIAQLDRTEYDNTLKDAMENLTTLQANLEMKVLDTAVTLTDLRDEIKNQIYVVEEARITLAESKYEPPATIRKAEINLNKAERGLEQLKKNYNLRRAQALADIKQTKQALSDGQALVKALQDFLAQFTIRAPADGIVLYKQEWNGTKRKAGSQVNPFDRVVATLPDLDSILSKTYVNEIEVSKVAVDQDVVITVDALPGKSFKGKVISVANVGEVLPNSDAKMFEVMIRIFNSEKILRPAMTSWNRIITKTFDNAIFIPTECVYTGADSIPFVYKKNKTRQIVILGDMNEKNVIVKQGLEPGTSIFVVPPENSADFRLVGESLIAEIRENK